MSMGANYLPMGVPMGTGYFDTAVNCNKISFILTQNKKMGVKNV